MDFDIMLDPEIQTWCEKYETVNTYSFMVYGDISDEEIEFVGGGVKIHLLSKGVDPPMMLFSKGIDEEEAKSLNIYRGNNVTVVVANCELSDYIIEIMLEGLNFLRFKCECLGTRQVTNYV
jgi:hypothetical protein